MSGGRRYCCQGCESGYSCDRLEDAYKRELRDKESQCGRCSRCGWLVSVPSDHAPGCNPYAYGGYGNGE